MKIFKKINPLKEEIKKQKIAGKTIGLLTTMGAIHSGHLSLVSQLKKRADIVVVTIFVNPKQFDNQEDYEKYPQNLEADIKKLQDGGADILFVPTLEEIYPNDFATSIKLGKLTDILCGATRPGHFDGMALIVSKLFNIVRPHLTIFGQKDFQQLQIVKKFNEDLNFNIEIIAAKTIREKNNLALSSRNLRLDENSQNIAPKIYQILSKIKHSLLNNLEHSDIESLLSEAKKELAANGFGKIDYLEIRAEKNLELVKKFNPKIKSRIFIAVYLKQIRLIDNLELS